VKYLALCALFLCGCGDGRIVRALNSVPAYYPVTTTTDSDAAFAAQMAQLDADAQESKLRQISDQLDDLRRQLHN
jgi:hypothetical protein